MNLNNITITHPEVAAEWHPVKNGTVIVTDISKGMNDKYWWVCKNNVGHEWLTTPNSRCLGGSGCPYCTSRIVCIENCLATNSPDLAKEFHPKKNYPLTSYDITNKSGKDIWWLCRKNSDHEWQATPCDRVTDQSDCPFCMNRRVHKSNCLSTLFPDLLSEWHPTKNSELSPDSVMASSGIIVWWQCEKGHEWAISCGSRTGIKKSGCPYCKNKKLGTSNSLAALFPELAKEFHPTKNGLLTPNDIVAGGATLIWWQCLTNKNHTFKVSCSSRILKESGCRSCYDSSAGVKAIEDWLEKEKIIFIREQTFPSLRSDRGRLLRFDFFLPDQRIFIEFDGDHHFRSIGKNGNLNSRQDNDKKKDEFATINKYKLIRIKSEKEMSKLPELVFGNQDK